MNDKDLMVKITDSLSDCLTDSSNIKIKRNPDRPKGFVEIYELNNDEDKKLIGKSNLVVYLGREWLISRAFNEINANIIPQPTEYITWFGVGNGGCPVGDPLNPTSPTNLDTDLDNPVMINATDAITCADYRLVPDVGYYKHKFDTAIDFEQDGDNYNYWLISKVSTTLGADDANGFNLSEAGLYTAASNAGGYGGPFNLYARVTFPSIVKTSARQLLFIWYIYF
ncbi:MAG TPA: hypothetical protein PKY72_05565 [Bacilli bacterium]|jgi:hypothetical protein|nr:hypothetical protein [Bacilli bacterium]